jgi:hypothetical protein
LADEWVLELTASNLTGKTMRQTEPVLTTGQLTAVALDIATRIAP